ncbi:fluoride efflux transporter CrcB [Nonomuraea cavernae]|uniref:Fluoride-specific ion channel FluC n=1 Tax=Nonomuraea cavernae TaxID=2045107 RepID=A0A918DRC9_9ACTN|nr:fluoride efflux transporter CrcB [Nonomuraea cavernae]MCA2190295.1 fluoride efflux transporter CrcB [Nonomuraea cavernae]GGO80546.1 putative fluoride ion transporter CrcB 2 [Nonomuraea cavernae]
MAILMVLIGGALGAMSRYALDRYVKQRAGRAFPWGTLTVNLLGSGFLGALHGAGTGTEVEALLGTGFCGALTTFSTFELDTVHLIQDGSYGKAAVNAVGSLILGFVAFAVCFAIVRALI